MKRIAYKMPKNISGGSKHKSQSSAPHPKAVKNARLVDAWIGDLKDKFPEGTMIGRATKRLGNGRFEVFAQDCEKKIHPALQASLVGGMKGRGKGSVMVGVGSVVLISDTGLVGVPYEIVAILEKDHILRIKYFGLDERLFEEAAEPDEGGFEFDDKDISEDDIDAI